MADLITPRSKDFSEWYASIIQHAQLCDYSPVRGCMVLRPNGYALWEKVQSELDKRFKETGHKNAYFPLFIPESLINLEKEHVDGFSPQLCVVTIAGGKKLEEPLIVRPTSETIINSMFAKWVKSYRDLPLLINQWANVVRWEMRTKPFLRTTEFLWQEGHTCHSGEEEAREETLRMLDIYYDVVQNYLAIPVIRGRKSHLEKFAGALETYSLEAMLQDKKALQGATSHYFGTQFAKAFGIKYLNNKGVETYVHQTSWGISTRIIGALILTHSDDKGLVLPPKIAPMCVVILPIFGKNSEDSPLGKSILTHAEALRDKLAQKNISTHIDNRTLHSLGYKITEWEVCGVPLRVEIGGRDVENKIFSMTRRDGKKIEAPFEKAFEIIEKELEDFQKDLFFQAQDFMHQNSFIETDFERFKKLIEERPGFYYVPWCGNDACENEIKETTKATSRSIPFLDAKKDVRLPIETLKNESCIVCKQYDSTRTESFPTLFARNY